MNVNAPLNMSLMSVTLDVSKSSGWSNATAPRNMPLMSVTLDVSKSSGWLNAVAPLNMSDMSLTLNVTKMFFCLPSASGSGVEGDGGGDCSGGGEGQWSQVCAQIMKWLLSLHLLSLSAVVTVPPSAFWQYSWSLGLFVSRHSSGGGEVGGMGGGQRGAQPSLHCAIAGWSGL